VFAPTPQDYFRYPDIVNIGPTVCNGCWRMTRTWMDACAKVITSRLSERTGSSLRRGTRARSAAPSSHDTCIYWTVWQCNHDAAGHGDQTGKDIAVMEGIELMTTLDAPHTGNLS
jgi:hypothetical protein